MVYHGRSHRLNAGMLRNGTRQQADRVTQAFLKMKKFDVATLKRHTKEKIVYRLELVAASSLCFFATEVRNTRKILLIIPCLSYFRGNSYFAKRSCV